MKIVFLCTLFVTIFGRHLGGDRVSIRDLGPVIEAYPEELNIQLNSRSGEWKVLNLRRRDKLNLDAPVYTTDDDGKVKRLPIRDLDSKAYQDVENGGAFLVKSERSKSGIYRRNIRGILDDGDYEILLEPVVNDASRKRSVDGKVEHTMIRRKIDRRYIDDGGLVYTKQSAIDKRSGRDDPVIVNKRSEPNITINSRADKPLYTVELLVVVDYEAYKRFSSVDKVKEYYSQLIVGVDLRYANIKSDFQITVKLTGFFFLDEAYKSAVTSDYVNVGVLQAGDSLNAFGIWRRDKISSLPSHDHAMLFSGYDLEYDLNRMVVGLAHVGTVCSEDYKMAVSIVEDLGKFKSVGCAAHELGHGLGSSHDGKDNDCKKDAEFIMGTTFRAKATGKNRYNFSPCSIAKFQAKIKELNDKGKNCLKNAAKSADPQVTQPPGQVWGVDEQCTWLFGDGSKYVAGGLVDHEFICKDIRCSRPNSTLPWVHSVAALRGTTCGNKKWCFEGDCVYDEMAPSAPAGNCTFGDATYALNVNGLSCSTMTSLSVCYAQEKSCCKTCPARKLTDAPKDCPYGDKADWCSKSEFDFSPGSPMCDANAKVCCKTCAKTSS